MSQNNTADSIQDFLAREGFSFDTYKQAFTKNGIWGQIEIPVDEIIGHTVRTFEEKARRKNWL